jgi:poly(A) polymerase
MGESLPPAEWTQREDLTALIAALGEGNARFVGGVVRDTLLGIEAKDIDIATVLAPDEVIARLDAAGIRNVPTGIDHGTVTAVLPNGVVEITTLRRDVSTDGRRAIVAFATDWREDAARRDFTINALYADPASGQIFDYFGGLADLADRRVRFLDDPHQRIREDHLRILRYFRFQTRFGSQPPDQESEHACADLAGTLKGLSRERIGMEFLALLGLPDPAPTIARMAELGVLPVILPEADTQALARLTAEERRQSVAPDPIRRLAALLPPEPSHAEQVAARFRLSGAQKKRLAKAASRVSGPKNARALAYHIGRDEAIDWLLLDGAEVAPLIDWEIPEFPLKGGAVVARGVSAGPEVARILLMVEAHWVAEGFPDAARVQELLDHELGGPDPNRPAHPPAS